MIRRFAGDGEAFALHTKNSSYLFRVLPTGHLEQLYYGKRIDPESPEELASLTEKRRFEPGGCIRYDASSPPLVPEDICLEFSAGGKGDIREPFLELVHADGSRTSDFLFEKAEISSEKPPFRTLPGSYAEAGAAEHLTVTLRDRSYDLVLELHYFVYPDCDCITRSALLRNESPERLEVERLLSLQLDLPDAGWAVTCFHGAWIREMDRDTVALPAGKFVMESRAGCSSSRMNPFFLLHDPAATEEHGAAWGFNLIYSGNHYEAVEVSAYGKTRVATGMNPHGFRWLLEPGESLEAPEAVMAFSPAGIQGVSRSMHRFVREHVVRGTWKRKPRPVLLNSWEASYFDFTEESLLSLAEAGKELGIELFVMDDGWFGERDDDSRSLGDWDVNLRKLPGGLRGLSDKLRALGLDFGLWVEPEMVNTDSELFRAHPDWAMAIPGKPHSEGRRQRVLDLANPAVQDFLIEKMTEVFSSADIRYVKWDFNRIFSDVYSPHLPPERQGETAHRYMLGFYRVMEALTARFPHILFEGCASGGNRFDLGILCYFPQIWASDNTDAVSRARIQEGYSFGYPLSVLGAHVSASPNHQTFRVTPEDTRFHVAAFGVLGYELDLRRLSEEERRAMAEEIALYKAWREVFQFGDFYRGRIGNLHEWTCVSPDKSRAVGLLLQELTRPNSQFERFFAQGLAPEGRYRFRSGDPCGLHEKEDAVASGESLMAAGVKLAPGFGGTGRDEGVRLFRDFSSRLYLMEKI